MPGNMVASCFQYAFFQSSEAEISSFEGIPIKDRSIPPTTTNNSP
jgi:hypothetical protein